MPSSTESCLAYDNPYVEMTFDGYTAPSILGNRGRKGHCRGVPLLLQDLLHDGLAPRLGCRELLSHKSTIQGEELR